MSGGGAASSAVHLLAAAAFAAGTAEGVAVLSGRSSSSSSNEDREEDTAVAGIEDDDGSPDASSPSASPSTMALLPSAAAYGALSVPLSIVGGSPGPALIRTIAPTLLLTHTLVHPPLYSPPLPPPMTPTDGRPAAVAAADAAAFPSPATTTAATDERSGPVRLGGRILRSEEEIPITSSSSSSSFEEAVPLLSERQRQARREGVRPLRRAPNLEPGPHSPPGALPSAEEAKGVAFDAAHASMRSPSPSASNEATMEREAGEGGGKGGRLRRLRPRPPSTPDQDGVEDPNVIGTEDLVVPGVSGPMRERAAEMRAARRTTLPESSAREEDELPPPTMAGAASTTIGVDNATVRQHITATSTSHTLSNKGGGGWLARYVSGLDGVPLPGSPASEAFRRARIGLVGLATVVALMEYRESSVAKASKGSAEEEDGEKAKAGTEAASSSSSPWVLERYLQPTRSGYALRLVPTDNFDHSRLSRPGIHSAKGAPVRILPIVVPPPSTTRGAGRNDDAGDDVGGAASSFATAARHWRLGRGWRRRGTETDWTDAPVDGRWLLRPDGSGDGGVDGGRAMLLVEADLSKTIHAHLSDTGAFDNKGEDNLAPETVRLAARCLAVAARRNGALPTTIAGEREGKSGEGVPDVVRVLVGSGPYDCAKQKSEEVEDDDVGPVVYVDGTEAVESALVRTLEDMWAASRDDEEEEATPLTTEMASTLDASDDASAEPDRIEEEAASEPQSSSSTVSPSPPEASFSSDPLGAVGSLVRRAGAGAASAAVSAVTSAGSAARAGAHSIVGTAARSIAAMGSVLHWRNGKRRRKILNLYADEVEERWLRSLLEREGWTVRTRGAASFNNPWEDDLDDDDGVVLVARSSDDATLDAASSILASSSALRSPGRRRGPLRLAALVESESSERTLRALAEWERERTTKNRADEDGGDGAVEGADPAKKPGGDEEETKAPIVEVVCARSVREGVFLRTRDVLARGGTVEEAQVAAAAAAAAAAASDGGK